MRFTIEQHHLTDAAGKPALRERSVAFFARDADDAGDAVRIVIREQSAEIIGDVLQFPGFHAIATMRSNSGVYTLQVSPASQPGTQELRVER